MDSETNALGHVTLTTHDPMTGERLLAVDPNGVATESRLDDLGRPIWTRRQGDASKSVVYEARQGGLVTPCEALTYCSAAMP